MSMISSQDNSVFEEIQQSGPSWYVNDNRLHWDVIVDCRYRNIFFIMPCRIPGLHDSVVVCVT